MLDDVEPALAQELAHVAEPFRNLADVHRGVLRNWGDREFELTDLVGDCGERLENRLAGIESGRGRNPTLRILIEFKFPTSPRVDFIVPVAVELVAV